MENNNVIMKAMDDLPSEIREGLNSLGLLVPFNHLLMSGESIATCHCSILKAERAKVLGFGKDVIKLCEKKAVRENVAALRQINGSNAAFKDRCKDKEWLVSVDKLTCNRKRELKHLQSETRERVIEAIFESDFNGGEVAEILEKWDEGAKSFSENGLAGVIE